VTGNGFDLAPAGSFIEAVYHWLSSTSDPVTFDLAPAGSFIAEGKEKGKGVAARRGLKEAQSETAGLTVR
jgi:hypothetical protein